jgi:hypothetical protein
MISKNFQYFLNQYGSIGSQKMDGYDESHFSSLTNTERQKAFELLKKECIAPGTAKWLFYLDYSKAVTFLNDYISKSSIEKSGIFRIYYELYIQTKIKIYQDLLIDNFFKFSEHEAEEAIWAIKSTKPDSERFNNLCKKIILTGEPEKTLITAADFFLRAYNTPFNAPNEKEQFYKIRTALTMKALNEKSSIILLIENNKFDETNLNS